MNVKLAHELEDEIPINALSSKNSYANESRAFPPRFKASGPDGALAVVISLGFGIVSRVSLVADLEPPARRTAGLFVVLGRLGQPSKILLEHLGLATKAKRKYAGRSQCTGAKIGIESSVVLWEDTELGINGGLPKLGPWSPYFRMS